jgi:hypothetical protein
MKLEDALSLYFRGEGPFGGLGLGSALKRTYQWKVPESAATLFDLSFEKFDSLYEANVHLKKAIKRKWDDAQDSRAAIVEWVIKDWGGISSNKPERLQEYVARLEAPLPPTPIHGIASFSKALAASSPENYAIYDARVAVALNAIQLKAAVTGGIIFPYLPGRNRVTGFQGKKSGFSSMPEYSVATLSSPPHTWQKLDSASAYQFYCKLLRGAKERLPGHELYDLEMALFSQAEELAKLVNSTLAENDTSRGKRRRRSIIQ